jgi:hypothetical protein
MLDGNATGLHEEAGNTAREHSIVVAEAQADFQYLALHKLLICDEALTLLGSLMSNITKQLDQRLS